MEDINIDEFVQSIDSKPVEITADGGVINEDKSVNWEEIFGAYLATPTKVFHAFSTLTPGQRKDAMAAGWARFYTARKITCDPPEVDTIDPSFLSRHKRGWNAGLFARTITDVNAAIAFNAQCEFVPALSSDDEKVYWCSKASYGSLPIAPGDPVRLRGISALLQLGSKGLGAKEYPDNFVNAILTSKKTQWRGPAAMDNIVKAAISTCSAPHQVALFVGEENAMKIMQSIADFSPEDARKIVPVSTKSKSIFANRIAQYNNLFGTVGRDINGPITTCRALASMFDGKGFYGYCGEVTYWLTKPSVLKCQNPPMSIVEHEVLKFFDNQQWPADCVMFAVTPQDVRNYYDMTKTEPLALVLPLTSVIGGGKHLTVLAERTLKVRVIVIYADDPLVCFLTEDADNGFNTNSLNSNLSALEKEIVVQLLTLMKQQLSGYLPHLIWEIAPTDTYGPNKCHVSWVKYDCKIKQVKQTYMAVNDVEKQMFTPTSHASEVKVNGKKVSHGDTDDVAINYIRCIPDFVPKYKKVLVPGLWYDEEGELLDPQPKRPDLYGATAKTIQRVSMKAAPVYEMGKDVVDGKLVDVMNIRLPMVGECEATRAHRREVQRLLVQKKLVSARSQRKSDDIDQERKEVTMHWEALIKEDEAKRAAATTQEAHDHYYNQAQALRDQLGQELTKLQAKMAYALAKEREELASIDEEIEKVNAALDEHLKNEKGNDMEN